MSITTIVLSIFCLSFASAYIHSVFRLRRITRTFTELVFAQAKLESAYDNYVKARNVVDNIDIDTQNFIKFLSDSREWAFSYIENVQDGLKKFIDEVEPHTDYYDSYGIIVEGILAPHDIALKKISTELKELKKFLPEETLDDRR